MVGMFSAIAIAAAGMGAAGASAARPIRLDVQSTGSRSIVRVVADGHEACKATYQLEVIGNGGGNRSVNGGTVTLPTNGPVAIATVQVANGGSAGTTATLKVSQCGGDAYEQVWKSPEASSAN